MKSAMPFWGIANAETVRIAKGVFNEHPLPTKAAWVAAVLDIYRRAEHREERYAALELTGLKAYRAYQGADLLPMYEELITTGAWWDYVDLIAIHRVGPILLKDPEVVKDVVVGYSRSRDMWLRRTSIICQVMCKAKTDTDLLQAVIEPNLADKEFFIRKAIGWALRQHAKTDAAWVRAYVEEHESKLSGLSRREAMKHLG